MDPWILELIGYIASALVAISLMMSSILRLRIINLAGAAAFGVYGVLIDAWPVAIVNAFIVLVNIYYLNRMLRTKEFFRLLEVRPDSDYLRNFLGFYRDQIRKFLPGFSGKAEPGQLIVFVLRDMVPAGLLMGEVQDVTLVVDLDFVIPQYRDFKIGRYLFETEAEFFRARGIREILSPRGSDEHAAYLTRMGFEEADEDGWYRLRLG
jgi:GNAT superfamily N-acetyltransferase